MRKLNLAAAIASVFASGRASAVDNESGAKLGATNDLSGGQAAGSTAIALIAVSTF